MFVRIGSLALVVALFAGCSSTPKATETDTKTAAPTTPAEKVSAEEEGAEKKAEKKKRPFLVSLLLYLPNRVLDLLDILRFGVDAGPGVGFQAQATELVQVKAATVISAGVGYQTLRHLPIQASAEAAAAVGPLGSEVGTPLPWYRSPTDVRLGLHFLVLGGHVAVDPKEWLDIPLGFLCIDIADDDL